jgi:hypothetical protein
MQTAVPDALQALMVLARSAQPTTPDGTPTVAAQLAQTTAPAQGIAQTVGDVEAALPSVMRNMQQDQLQAMVKQAMQPQAAGIEGLAAPNMQFADGGVVGFAGEGPSLVTGSAPDYQDARRFGIDLSPYDSPEVIAQKRERVRKMREFEAQMAQGRAEIPTEAGLAAAEAASETQRLKARPTNVMGQIAPTPQRAPRPGTGRPTTPAPAPAAPVAGATAPAVGIAQNLPAAPTLAGAVQEAQRVMPSTSLDRNREAVEELKRMRAAMPDAGLATLAALEEERRVAADIKRRLDESKRDRGISAWFNSAGQLGSRGRGVAAFEEAERFRAQNEAALNTARAARMDAIRDANRARKAGDQEKYLEALNKISELERAEKQIQAQLAGAGLTAATNVRSQDIGAATSEADRRSREREGAADRATRLKVANIGESNRNAAMTDPRKVFDTLMDNARAEYDKWTKTLEGARASTKPELARAKRIEFLEQQVRLARATGVQGLEPLLEEIKRGGSGTAPAGRGQREVDFSSIR